MVTLKFYNPSGTNTAFFVNGNYALEHSVVVPGNGTVDVVLSDPNGLKTGSFDVKTVYGSGVNTQATYSNSFFEATIPSSIPNKDTFYMNYDNTGRNSTGIALVNYLNYPQEITFTFFDSLGIQLYVNKLTIPAKGQTALTLDATFPQTKGKYGVLQVKTTRPALTGFGLKFNLDKGYFTTSSIF